MHFASLLSLAPEQLSYFFVGMTSFPHQIALLHCCSPLMWMLEIAPSLTRHIGKLAH